MFRMVLGRIGWWGDVGEGNCGDLGSGFGGLDYIFWGCGCDASYVLMPACFSCGENGPYGFRFPGARSSVPGQYRGYLWACSQHCEEAEQRWDAAFSKARAAGEVEPEQISMGEYLRDRDG